MKNSELRRLVNSYREDAHDYLNELRVLLPKTRSNPEQLKRLMEITHRWYQTTDKCLTVLKKLYVKQL